MGDVGNFFNFTEWMARTDVLVKWESLIMANDLPETLQETADDKNSINRIWYSGCCTDDGFLRIRRSQLSSDTDLPLNSHPRKLSILSE